MQKGRGQHPVAGCDSADEGRRRGQVLYSANNVVPENISKYFSLNTEYK